MKNLVLLIIVALFAVSCINLKEPYPKINYYRISPEKSSVEHIKPLDATIMIRDFSASSEIETTHLLTMWDNDYIQRYYYYRWVADAPSMVGDFINNTFSKNKIFEKGVVTSSSMAVPDYILEGEILDMMAYSTKDGNTNGNYVYVAIKINLIKRTRILDENPILLSEVYNFKIVRQNNSVKSIPDAFSRAWSHLADQILIDIHRKIGKELEAGL